MSYYRAQNSPTMLLNTAPPATLRSRSTRDEYRIYPSTSSRCRLRMYIRRKLTPTLPTSRIYTNMCTTRSRPTMPRSKSPPTPIATLTSFRREAWSWSDYALSSTPRNALTSSTLAPQARSKSVAKSTPTRMTSPSRRSGEFQLLSTLAISSPIKVHWKFPQNRAFRRTRQSRVFWSRRRMMDPTLLQTQKPSSTIRRY